MSAFGALGSNFGGGSMFSAFQSLQSVALSAQQTIASAKPAPIDEAGTMIIADTFQSDPMLLMQGDYKHGDTVRAAATGQGLQGPVIARQDQYSPLGEQVYQDGEVLRQPNADPATFRQALNDQFVSQCTLMLDNAAQHNRAILGEGANHGVVNYSEGYGKSRMVGNTYTSMRRAWTGEGEPDQLEDGKNLLHNYSTAFGLDEQKLLSSRPEVAGPERARLQSHLIGQAEQAFNGNSLIGAAKTAYDQSTRELEQARISPVIAAGNDGKLPALMQQDANGVAPRLPADFFDNPLSNAHTVTVGATGEFNDEDAPGVSSYSNPSHQVALFASGEIHTQGMPGIGYDNYYINHENGTSYAAPRVGTELANVHRQHLDFSNQQALQYVLQNSTHSVDYNGTAVPVLNSPQPLSFAPMEWEFSDPSLKSVR